MLKIHLKFDVDGGSSSFYYSCFSNDSFEAKITSVKYRVSLRMDPKKRIGEDSFETRNISGRVRWKGFKKCNFINTNIFNSYNTV